MNAHKRAVLEAWREHPLWGNESTDYLGGTKVLRAVHAYLHHQLLLAHEAAALEREVERGKAWWFLYIEKPADDGLLSTLRATVPKRREEKDEDYLERLRAVENAMRARLSPYVETFGETHAKP